MDIFNLAGETKLWGRLKGREVRERIYSQFEESTEKTLKLSFANIEILDFSFASEVIAILVSRLANELKGKHIILSNMNSFVQENISIALEKAELCALAINDTEWNLIGKCSEALKLTFKLLLDLKESDTPELAKILNSTVHSLNNRLKTLMALGLVDRTEIASPSGGKQYIYKAIY